MGGCGSAPRAKCSRRGKLEAGIESTLTTEDAATAPNPTHSAREAVTSVGGHGCLDHLQRLGWSAVLSRQSLNGTVPVPMM